MTDRPRYPRTDAGLKLARQSLSKPVTIDQILDIEDEAASTSHRDRLAAIVRDVIYGLRSQPELDRQKIAGVLEREVLAALSSEETT